MTALTNHVVLDSNVIVSANLKPRSISADALEIAAAHFDIVASRETLAELLDVLKRPKFDRYLSLDNRMEDLRDYINITKKIPVTLIVADCTDPKDNKFLALARQANAVLIVTGDAQDLLSMSPYCGIDIIGVRAFTETYQQYITL